MRSWRRRGRAGWRCWPHLDEKAGLYGLWLELLLVGSARLLCLTIERSLSLSARLIIVGSTTCMCIARFAAAGW